MRKITKLDNGGLLWTRRYSPRLYFYTEGGEDKKTSKKSEKVPKTLISFFLRHDLDEVIAKRPTAGHSDRNSEERFHCIANLGLLSVGMMRTK